MKKRWTKAAAVLVMGIFCTACGGPSVQTDGKESLAREDRSTAAMNDESAPDEIGIAGDAGGLTGSQAPAENVSVSAATMDELVRTECL